MAVGDPTGQTPQQIDQKTKSLQTMTKVFETYMSRQREGTSVAKAYAKALESIAMRSAKVKDSIKELQDKVDSSNKRLENQKEVLKDLKEAQSAYTKNDKQWGILANKIAEAEVSLVRLNTQVKQNEREAGNLEEAYKKSSRSINLSMNKVVRVWETANKSMEAPVGVLGQIDKMAQMKQAALLEEERLKANIAKKQDKFDKKAYDATVTEISSAKKLSEIREEVLEEMRDRNLLSSAVENSERIRKNMEAALAKYLKFKEAGMAKQGAEDLKEGIKQGGGRIKEGIKGFIGGKGFGAKMEGLKSVAEGAGVFKSFYGEIRKTHKELGPVAAGFKALSTAFSVMMKGNVLMAIASMLMMLVEAGAKAVMELDKFIKDVNKQYFKIAGPTVMMGDATKTMRSFSNAVFDMGRNLKYGLKSEEIMGFFDSMSQAGMSAQGAGSRIKGGYNEAIVEATKMSRNFGVSLSDMGSMIGDQMLNLRMSMDDVRDSFDNMSYGASIAGVQSQKFYQAIDSATSSLSFYGKFLKEASNLTRSYSETGAMGFKDAASQAQKLMGIFEKADFGKKLQMIMSAGGADVFKEAASKLSSAEEKRAQDAKSTITELSKSYASAMARGDTDLTRSIESQMDSQRKLINDAEVNIQQLASTTDPMALAQVLGKFSGNVQEIIVDLMRKLPGKLSSQGIESQAIMETVSALFGTDNETMMGMQKQVQIFETNLTKFLTGTGKLFEDQNFKPQFDAIKEAVKGLSDGTITDYNELEKTIRANAKAMGMSEEQITDLWYNIRTNASGMNEVLTKGIRSYLDESGKVLGSKVYQASLTGIGKVSGMTAGKGKEDNRIEDLVKQTTPISDMLGISEENLKYTFASSDLQSTIAAAAVEGTRKIGGLLGVVTAWFRYSQKDATKKIDEYKASAERSSLVTLMGQQKTLGMLMKDVENKKAEGKLTSDEAATKLADYKKQMDAVSSGISLSTSGETYGEIKDAVESDVNADAIKKSSEIVTALTKIDAELSDTSKTDAQKKVLEEQRKSLLGGMTQVTQAVNETSAPTNFWDKLTDLAVSLGSASDEEAAYLQEMVNRERLAKKIANVKSPTPQEIVAQAGLTTPPSTPPATGGWLNNLKNPSIDYGAMANGAVGGAGHLAGKMGASAAAAPAVTNITVVANIDTAVSNNDWFAKNFAPAVKQAVNQGLLEHGARK